MSDSVSAVKLAEEVKALYRSGALRPADADQAEAALETWLSERLAGVAATERVSSLNSVIRHLQRDSGVCPAESQLEEDVFLRLYSLIMGKPAEDRDLPVAVLYERLAESLNTVFDSLNELIMVIHSTLADKSQEIDTIRTVIGSRMGDEGNFESLETYLGQIKKSFLIAHQAFREAAQAKVGSILDALDPDHLPSLAGGGSLGFGPFRKAELFELYQDQFRKCRDWFASGRFMEELLREFERKCQQLSK